MTGRICNCYLGSFPLQWDKKADNQFNIEGGYAFFSYAIKGSGCIRYRWYNPLGELILGERTPILEICPITPASFGKYRLEVTNCLQEQLTEYVNLFLEKRFIDFPYQPIDRKGPYKTIPNIRFFQQPANIAVPLGFPAELKVSVEATAPKFQWYVYCDDNDLPIHGQTKHKLSIDEVHEYNYGTFYVRVTDLFGQTIPSIPAKIQKLHIERSA